MFYHKTQKCICHSHDCIENRKKTAGVTHHCEHCHRRKNRSGLPDFLSNIPATAALIDSWSVNNRAYSLFVFGDATRAKEAQSFFFSLVCSSTSWHGNGPRPPCSCQVSRSKLGSAWLCPCRPPACRRVRRLGRGRASAGSLKRSPSLRQHAPSHDARLASGQKKRKAAGDSQ